MPTIAVLSGDGIGPEVVAQGVRALKAALGSKAASWSFNEALAGWAAIDATGTALPEHTREVCRSSDAILFGAVGLPDRDATLPPAQRPEPVSLLALRKGLYANLRPAILYPEFASLSALRHDVALQGVDLLIVRELTGGLYYGQPKGRTPIDGGERAVDTMTYTTAEIERIARVAFESARVRRKQVCSVDKANILACSQLWRDTVTRVGKDYPDVQLTHLLVDACAMELVRAPRQFDVIVTENTFGDILSDEASMLVGSLGMLPSASLGDGSLPYFYEPIHGTAPTIAGKDIANPLAAILTVAMLLRYSFQLEVPAQRIEQAVQQALRLGARTADLMQPGCQLVGTCAMGDLVVKQLENTR